MPHQIPYNNQLYYIHVMSASENSPHDLEREGERCHCVNRLIQFSGAMIAEEKKKGPLDALARSLQEASLDVDSSTTRAVLDSEGLLESGLLFCSSVIMAPEN